MACSEETYKAAQKLAESYEPFTKRFDRESDFEAAVETLVDDVHDILSTILDEDAREALPKPNKE